MSVDDLKHQMQKFLFVLLWLNMFVYNMYSNDVALVSAIRVDLFIMLLSLQHE